MLNRRELLQTAAAAAVAPTVADPWADVVAFLEAEGGAGTFPGASLIASKGGKVRFERQMGTCCRLKGRGAPLGPETVHPLFSFSKLVSATVVVMAHQDG